MNDVAFEAYANQAQGIADGDFSSYKLRVALFAVLGYAVLFAMLFILIGIAGGVVAMAFFSTALFVLLLKKKLLLVVIPIIWIMARALWVRFEEPQGYELTKERFPVLHREIDDLREQLKAKKIHSVILTPELNAAIAQTPRLGVFGWHKNTLILGLELMLTMTPAQARAVIAHELGHLSGNHAKFNGWIYRVRMSWFRILEGLRGNDSLGALALIRFFDWYAPRFSAFTFPLARANEYEADAVSAELTSPGDAAGALVNVSVTAPFVDQHYWNTFLRQADVVEQPEYLPWQGFHDFLASSNNGDLEDHLAQALSEKTGFRDTHPCLSDRLNALGESPRLNREAQESAAALWFGAHYESVLRDFDEDWHSKNAERWRQRYTYVKDSNARLEELENRGVDALSDEELWQLAELRREFVSLDAALDSFRLYAKRDPDSPNCAFAIGRILRSQNNPECLDVFRQSLANSALAYDASRLAFDYATQVHDNEAIAFWENELNKAIEREEAINRERSNLSTEDTLLPADLDDETLRRTIEQLKASKGVRKIWVARKQMQYDDHIPSYTIAVTLQGFALSEQEKVKQVLSEIDPFNGWLIPRHGELKKLAKFIIRHAVRVA